MDLRGIEYLTERNQNIKIPDHSEEKNQAQGDQGLTSNTRGVQVRTLRGGLGWAPPLGAPVTFLSP
jgi:hypothetical protein